MVHQNHPVILIVHDAATGSYREVGGLLYTTVNKVSIGLISEKVVGGSMDISSQLSVVLLFFSQTGNSMYTAVVERD